MAKTKINDNEPNPIELALSNGEDAVDNYLANVEVEEFIYHVKNLKYRYANKGVIQSVISSMNELMKEPVYQKKTDKQSVQKQEEKTDSFEEDNSLNEKAEADERDAKSGD